MSSPQPCTVRVARPEDVPVLCRLKWQFALGEGSTFVVRATPADWMRDMFGPQPRFSAVVAEAGDGTVIGMATVTLRFCPGWVGPLCAIDDLFVLPEHRGKGIGKALVAGAAAHALARGAPFLELTVREDNPALRLYERIGFERVPASTLVLAGNALAELTGNGLAALADGVSVSDGDRVPDAARDAAAG